MFSSIGNTLGGIVGGVPGSLIKSAGSFLGRITGMGAYRVQRNSLLTDSGPPMFGTGGAGTRIRHREFLGDITGSTAFALTSYAINPGMSTTFPWLAQIAVNFEEYEFHGLIFEFKSTSANALNSTNTALGTVVLASEYNVARPLFTSKQAMEAYEFATSTVPSSSTVHPVECKPSLNVYTHQYVRSTAVALGDDLAKYDVANFQIATTGMQAAATIGELWVSYDVSFLKPRLPPSTTLNPGAVLHSRSMAFSSATAAAPAGSTGMTSIANTLGATVVGGTGTISVSGLPVGYYMAMISVIGSTITNGNTVSFPSGAVGVAWMQQGTGQSAGAFTSSSICNTTCFRVPSIGSGTIIFTFSATGLTAGDLDVVIAPIPNLFTVDDEKSESVEERLEMLESILRKTINNRVDSSPVVVALPSNAAAAAAAASAPSSSALSYLLGR